jgi:hypothetical protein
VAVILVQLFSCSITDGATPSPPLPLPFPLLHAPLPAAPPSTIGRMISTAKSTRYANLLWQLFSCITDRGTPQTLSSLAPLPIPLPPDPVPSLPADIRSHDIDGEEYANLLWQLFSCSTDGAYPLPCPVLPSSHPRTPPASHTPSTPPPSHKQFCRSHDIDGEEYANLLWQLFSCITDGATPGTACWKAIEGCDNISSAVNGRYGRFGNEMSDSML